MTNLRRLHLALAISSLVAAAPLSAQRYPRPVRVCTNELTTLSLNVRQRDGRPVQQASVIVRNARTGAVLRRYASSQPSSGNFVILDDGARSSIRAGGEPIEIMVSNGAARGTVRWRVGLGPGDCHVKRLSGPATLTLR